MAFFVEHILPFLGGVLLGVGIGLAVLFAVLLVRTLLFRPKRVEKKEFSPVSFDREAAVEALAALVRCKTVSNRDRALEDDAEFEKLISLLPTLYPNVARVCTFKRLPDRAILFHWQGKSADEPAVLMAHYDVVPVEEENWKKP
ncbi:MAG: peptidase M20, partial [Clostridia bacterium]|nr:peptidase M20 [Clostridia bacterium]